MASELKKFEEKRKTSIANTIGSGLRLWVEELSRAVSGTKKPTAKWETLAKNQISRELDTYENARIEKNKKQS
ncbi:MAG: hypothetical protein ACD_80C00109G0008 [uncultured bacterium (gcode 4)]|uniref:Uncharacterized protein n=1 Tax=uncultured bacterium (gcode 4) TaxID=1234023 RepID=K1XXY8_9BACT|nr:MAG: hypothetical protein ACD_80C00109G0008 [uncultured bacterium (gcode 4)]